MWGKDTQKIESIKYPIRQNGCSSKRRKSSKTEYDSISCKSLSASFLDLQSLGFSSSNPFLSYSGTKQNTTQITVIFPTSRYLVIHLLKTLYNILLAQVHEIRALVVVVGAGGCQLSLQCFCLYLQAFFSHQHPLPKDTNLLNAFPNLSECFSFT